MKNKQCRECGTTFMPKARANLYCEICAGVVQKRRQRDNTRRYRKRKAEEEGRLHRIGIGKGGGQPKGTESYTYKNGMCYFKKRAPEIRHERRYCERCGKDLKDVGRYHWCLHHKDHNRQNNTESNFELLCKRCHQVEHKCWEAFEGSTTSS